MTGGTGDGPTGPEESRASAGAGGRAPHDRGALRALRTGAGWLLTIGAAFFGAGLATCGYRLVVDGAEEPASERSEVLRPTPQVLTAVRDLARLESVNFHMERVIDLRDRQTQVFGLVEVEDAILLVAAGDVSAGVDLTEMRDGDVVVDLERHTATVVLPAPRILSTRLDGDRTFVHTRETDMLARRSETLETRARQEAERTLHDAALEAGILERARANAERTIATLVRSLGYDRVEVRWRAE